jgi:hypothetical protein
MSMLTNTTLSANPNIWGEVRSAMANLHELRFALGTVATWVIVTIGAAVRSRCVGHH